MSQQYFELLRKEAVARDARVLPIAMAIYRSAAFMRMRFSPAQVPSMWYGLSFDAIVRLSHGLYDLEQQFVECMQGLLASGRVVATVMDAGQLKRTLDPDIFVDDGAVLTEAMLAQIVAGYSPE